MPEKKGQQGTGKHPHKSTEEPFPHTKENESGGQGQGKGAGTARAKEQKSQSQSGASDDLKQREYRDKDGNIHHHTRTYEEQHKNDKE